MKKTDWVWMPHAGHFILGHKCRFHLNTYVGNYIVSTVGELWNERGAREINAEVEDPRWLMANNHLLGDSFDNAYMKRFGYEQIGCDRKYETMVFKSRKTNNKCCPYRLLSPESVDFAGYNTDEDAVAGHLRLCNLWTKKK